MLDKKLILIFWDSKENRFSINSLLGAIENNEIVYENIIIFLINNKEELYKIINEYNKNLIIICFSFFTTQYCEIKDLIFQIKNNFKNILLIAGGAHATGSYNEVLNDGFDIIVYGEGEKTFIEVLNLIINQNLLENIKHQSGIIFKENENIIKNKRNNYIKLEDYFPFSKRFKRSGPIEISRGCPYGCYFCQTPTLLGSKVRHRSIENIIDIIKYLLLHNIKDFRFISSNAFAYGSIDGKTINYNALKTLLNEIRKTIKNHRRIFFGTFPSEVRPEFVTEETLSLIKEYANNDNIIIGGQSGSQNILDKCHRQHTVESIINAAKLCKKFKIKANIDLIFGLPDETQEDEKLNLELMKVLIENNAYIHAHFFIPLPGTKFGNYKPKLPSKDFLKTIEYYYNEKLLYGDYLKQMNFVIKNSKLDRKIIL